MLRCRINVSLAIWCYCRHLTCGEPHKFVISRSLKWVALNLFLTKKVSDINGKAIPVQVYCRPWGVQVVEAPRLRENRHMRLVSLSALRTGDLYLHRKYSWHSFDLRVWADPRAILRAEGLRQWKIPMKPSGIKPAAFRLVAQWSDINTSVFYVVVKL
jgi:hypothetical protein